MLTMLNTKNLSFQCTEYIAHLHLASIISSCDKVKMPPRLTPELTGRGHNTDIDKLTMRDMLTRAPVQLVVRFRSS
jgi:hypothetical protein